MDPANTCFTEPFLYEQLLYQLLLYLPLGEWEIEENQTIGEIIAAAEASSNETSLPVIKNILNKQEELGLCTIGDISWLDYDENGKPDYSPKGLVACTFTNPVAASFFVVFRGTPKGAWLDNAKMLIGDPAYCQEYTDQEGRVWKLFSPLQAEAMEYLEVILERNREGWKSFNHHYVIGHSKGGNQAQLAAMLYGTYFEAGFSMDGPGMSNEAIEEMKNNLGMEQYQQLVSKLCGFNASNDYVHGLGCSIIPETQIKWFKEYENGIPVVSSHSALALINTETGELAPFTDGPGPAACFADKLSEVAMELDMQERAAVFMTVMGFFQVVMGRSAPVNPEDEDWIRFVADLDNGAAEAAGIVLCVMMNTEEGKELLVYLNEADRKELPESFYDKTIHWYQSQPLAEQAKVANGIAGIMILKVIFPAAISKIITMAEIIIMLRDMLRVVEELGKSLLAAYIPLVSVLVNGYLCAVEQIREILLPGN